MTTSAVQSHSRPAVGLTRLMGAIRQHWFGYLLVAPILLWLLLTIIIPLFAAFDLSLQNIGIIGSPGEYIGLQNYTTTLQSQGFWASAGRSAVWVVGNAIFQTLLGFATALLLNQNLPGVRVARVWMLLPWVVPTVVVVVIWRWMLGSSSLVNFVLMQSGLIRLPVSFFGSQASSMATLILINTWRWFPLTTLFVLAGLQTIPDELYEAAKVDGASAMQRFRFITLPSLRNILTVLGLIGFLWSVNVFDIIWLLTQGGPSDGTMTLPVYVYNTAFKKYALSEAAAASIIFGALLIVLAFLYLRFIGSPDRED
jgi:multiple sugar transport system permease protein